MGDGFMIKEGGREGAGLKSTSDDSPLPRLRANTVLYPDERRGRKKRKHHMDCREVQSSTCLVRS
jgi:hypothetical protein